MAASGGVASGAWGGTPTATAPDGPWRVLVPRFTTNPDGTKTRAQGFHEYERATYGEAAAVVQQHGAGGSIQRVLSA